MRWFKFQLSILFFFLCAYAGNVVYAHPFHTTVAEMEFNPITGRFEVALKIHASDFETMVRAGQRDLELTDPNGKPISSKVLDKELNKTGDERNEQKIAHYLKNQFSVSLAGTPCRFEWVGMEDEKTSKWLYFELIVPEGASTSAKLSLTNKVLCDSNLGQINTVVFLSKTARVSLKTHEHQTVVDLPTLE